MAEENNNEEQEDPLKWEKLYFAPRRMQQRTTASSSSPSGQFDSRSKAIVDEDIGFHTNTHNNDNNNAVAVTTQKTTSSPRLASTNHSQRIRVITFDLDNTIWKTSETISDANDALAAHLFEEYGIAERSEKVMGRLFRQHPERYAGVDHVAAAGTMGSSVDDHWKDSKDEDDDDDSPDDDDIVRNVGRSEPQVRATGRLESETNIIGVDENTTMKTTKPVYLTLLRKDAIRSLLLLAGNDDDHLFTTLPTTSSSSSLDLERRTDAAFEVWMEVRCRSISKNLVPGAVSTLRRLRSSRRPVVVPPHPTTTSSTTTTTTCNEIYVGAITDGNSHPNRVPELSGMFDFVVRAEDVGASKPDARVYKAAVASLMARLVREGRNVEEFFLGGGGEAEGSSDDDDDTAVPGSPPPPATCVTSESGSSVVLPLHWKDIDEDAVEAFSEAVGPWWVHVGDDFFKDVVAAKEFRMRTVWSRELIGGSGISSDGTNNDNDSSNNNIIVIDGNTAVEARQRSVSDLANDIAKSDDGILKMPIGPSEYLSQSIHAEFSDAILDRFGDLCDLVLRWQEESTVSQWNKDNNNVVEAALASEEQIMASDGSAERTHPVEDVSREYKFCISCGIKLPVAAKFCSRCGEKQLNPV